jgi:hypothetical protein
MTRFMLALRATEATTLTPGKNAAGHAGDAAERAAFSSSAPPGWRRRSPRTCLSHAGGSRRRVDDDSRSPSVAPPGLARLSTDVALTAGLEASF